MSPTGWLTMIVSSTSRGLGDVYKRQVLSTPKETEYLGSPTPPLPENAEE